MSLGEDVVVSHGGSMRQGTLQVLLLMGMLLGVAAEEKKMRNFYFNPLTVKEAYFEEVSMLEKERNDYATNLTRLAVAQMHEGRADELSLSRARKFLSLALNLSPRNRPAMVTNHQLGKGILPDLQDPEYSTTIFSRLLLSRAKLLAEGETLDRELAVAFTDVSAELDPRNTDAVYAHELYKLEDKELDWDLLEIEASGGQAESE